MDLTEAQKTAIADWVESGAELADVQQRLKEEFELILTYLDTRFLLGDLGLELLSDREDTEADTPEETVGVPGGEDAEVFPPGDDGAAGGGLEDTPPDADLGDDDAATAIPGKVTVTVDSIAQPHAIVSGRVTFSDGQSAGWYLDQMGRLGLDPANPDYRPAEEDVAAFQMELQNVLRQQGL